MKTYLFPGGSGAFALIWILLVITFLFLMFSRWGFGGHSVTY
jgi:hypothetical protein